MYALAIGLIPAYAGRTHEKSRLVCECWAHPRLRGADELSAASLNAAAGSSPLTRGGLHVGLISLDGERLIPAYAGRTWGFGVYGATEGAHPRLRGADPNRISRRACGVGSSPLTRGGHVNV